MKGKVIDLEIDDFIELIVMKDRAMKDAQEKGYKVLEQARTIEELQSSVKTLTERVHSKEWVIVAEVFRYELSKETSKLWNNYTPERFFEVYQFLDPDDEKTKRLMAYGIDLKFAKHVILQEIESVMNDINGVDEDDE